jgi:hypothetical protein
MRRILFSFVLASICANVATAGPSPTTLEVIQGPVFVDQGKGLIAVDRFTLLRSGDRILIKEGSTALLVNKSAGCVLSLREAGMFEAPDMSNCHTGQASVMKTNVTITPANGVYVAAPASNFGAVAAGLGFVAVAGAAAVYSSLTESATDEPVSSF